MKRLHILLAFSSLTLIALSINRLTSLTLGYVAPNQFLRWVDLNAMLPISLATVIIYYLLIRHITRAGKLSRPSLPLVFNLVFIVGIYIFGTSSGDHETTNYLHGRFCDMAHHTDRLCSIIAYHDDTFSHLLYYGGLILMTCALLGFQAIYQRKDQASNKDLVLLAINALIIALAVFANIASEPAFIDMIAFGFLAIASTCMLLIVRKRFRQYPVIFYLALAYGMGIGATLIYKLAG